MNYYITADVHGFYTEFHKALDEAGYFTDLELQKQIFPDNILQQARPRCPARLLLQITKPLPTEWLCCLKAADAVRYDPAR